ncbi:G patch domain-containing protein 1, partial [Operophtera brumata]
MTKSPTEVIDMTSKKELNPADYISIKDSGRELTNVFKPFVTNPKKQARYEMYCEKGVLERDGDMDNLKEWERERELVEFEQAAKLYRPLTGLMGDSIKVGSATAEQAAAAARGVYGVMTRAHAAWRPDTVVCKRFNIPEPNVTRLEPKEDERPKVSYSVFSYMESSVHDKSSFTKEQGTFSGSKSHRHHTDTDPKTGTTGQNPQSTNQVPETTKHTAQPMPVEKISEQTNPYKRITVAELFMKESEDSKKQGKEVTETIEKFDKIDLYKSIFLSDSEDETEDPKTVENTQEKLDFVEVPKNLVRNNSPPRGIFANIDFDELNSWRRTDDKPDKATEIKPEDNEMQVETYGPKIPDSLKQRLESGKSDPYPHTNKDSKGDDLKDVQLINSSSDDSWVDAKH